MASRPDDKSFELVWDEREPPASNYARVALGLLARGDLFRRPEYGGGLVLKLPHGKQAVITRGSDLAPIIVDRINVLIVKDGKTKGGRIDQGHLNSMLKAEAFLAHFPEVDLITPRPISLPDFSLTKPGFNDGGPGHRIFYDGDEPAVADSQDAIRAFLDVMAFDTDADRTNAVAAALTVTLRNHWPGGKPILVVTATKSHAGKDTVIAFAAGIDGSVSISYQGTDWALERSFVGAVDHCPEAGIIVVENARLDRRDRYIASAFIERFATDPEPLLYSTGGGHPVRRRNHLLVAISTNFGTVSEDIMNRSLPIRLRPEGDLVERTSPIGNPKLEYLPANRERIAAELRGMIRRWIAAGCPLDEEVRHPFSVWAKTIGGILKVNGFLGFLANYGQRRSSDDPLRQGLGILGAAKPGDWFGPEVWARVASDLGLVKEVIPPRDQDSPEGRRRGIGVVLSSHVGETFQVETDSEHLWLRLEKRRGRWEGGEPKYRYRFEAIKKEPLQEDSEEAPPTNGREDATPGELPIEARAGQPPTPKDNARPALESKPLDPETIRSSKPGERFMAFQGDDLDPAYFLLATSEEEANAFARGEGDDTCYVLACPTIPREGPCYDATLGKKTRHGGRK